MGEAVAQERELRDRGVSERGGLSRGWERQFEAFAADLIGRNGIPGAMVALALAPTQEGARPSTSAASATATPRSAGP